MRDGDRDATADIAHSTPRRTGGGGEPVRVRADIDPARRGLQQRRPGFAAVNAENAKGRLSAGLDQNCGLRPDGTAVCWGSNGSGQATPPAGTFSALAAGGFHTCGLRPDATATCWGMNTDGQATAPGGTFTALTAGGFHTCGLRTNGTATCWGSNANNGQATPPAGTFTALAAGYQHTCGIRTNGTATCWGNNAQVGMMIIVGILRRTGVFEYIAIWAAKRGKGSPLRVMVLLVLITALASAFLDNVTTILLVAPVTLLVCERLAVSPIPFLIAEVLASNLGGAATLIGDPPNIIIASRSGLSFNDFLLHMAPMAALAVAALVAMLPLLFRGSFRADPDRVANVMGLDEREAIKDRRLLIICGVVLAGVFTGFIAHSALHIEPSVVALLGAGLLILLSRSKPRDFMPSVEWETLLFFVGLFVMVGALVKTGVISRLAEGARGRPAATRSPPPC